ncbi:winged helix-turn-helix transcriptional regulator [Candidatus Woesearchaeota archaeon]|nr:winged helix-turn-helix transcriptional regulator [Candidatus Woesearchaeota archaeon]
MDYEQLFVESKWGILKSLAEKGMSPLELAHALNTTISNVSQQLRLLEMAGLVEKEKVQNRDKGKPRAIYSISEDYLYLILVSKSSARKQLLLLSPVQMMLLNVWLNFGKDDHYFLERFCLYAEEAFTSMKALGVEADGRGFKGFILSGSKGGKNGLFKVNRGSEVKEFEYSFLSEDEFLKRAERASILYDPQGILRRLTGGLENEKRKR